jgi:hypothetical protein
VNSLPSLSQTLNRDWDSFLRDSAEIYRPLPEENGSIAGPFAAAIVCRHLKSFTSTHEGRPRSTYSSSVLKKTFRYNRANNAPVDGATGVHLFQVLRQFSELEHKYHCDWFTSRTC